MRPFLETEMWYLLYNIVRAGKEYERNDRKIGDVQPSNIVINEDGQIKIISQDSWPNILNNFQRHIESPKDKVLLAPEESSQEALKSHEYPKGISPQRAEVFSIGLTLLEAGTLADANGLASNLQKLQGLLGNLREKYGATLCSTVESMLLFTPEDRPTCGQLHALFLPYEDHILNIEEFAFNPQYSLDSLNKYNKQNASRIGRWSPDKILGARGPVQQPQQQQLPQTVSVFAGQGVPVGGFNQPNRYTTPVPQPQPYPHHYSQQIVYPVTNNVAGGTMMSGPPKFQY